MPVQRDNEGEPRYGQGTVLHRGLGLATVLTLRVSLAQGSVDLRTTFRSPKSCWDCSRAR